jgi:hypothetical protein
MKETADKPLFQLIKTKTNGMFNLAKPNSGLANPSWVCLVLTEHTKMEFVKPLFLFVFLNGCQNICKYMKPKQQ